MESTVFIQPESEIPCLLGMNILPQLGLKFVQPNGEPLGTQPVCVEACQVEEVSSVKVISSTYLPNHKITLLEADISTPFSDGDILMFEPNQKVLLGEGLQIPDALLTQQPNGHVYIPVENSWAVSARLEPGTCLGQVTHCPEPELKVEESTVTVSEINLVTRKLSAERQTELLELLHLEQSSATAEEIAQLDQFVRENADMFALDNTELGHTDVVQHHVDTGDHRPIKQPVRRVPFVHRETIAKLVKEMEEVGVIKPSSSPWASPVVLVPKKDGTTRFCIDYRKLNSMTKKDVYPLPRIDDILDTLGGARYFTSLDLASGYWQVSLDAESRTKSAFITHQGLHEFVRMPFGMYNAPATFQRLIEIVLAGQLWKSCFAYIDDLLICSQTFQEHLEHLRDVFARLLKAGLRLKAKKCLFLREEVPYLGYVVTKDGIKPDTAKTDKMQNYPVPTNVSQVRQFLGLASYYRRFVPDFSRIASPLHSLLKRMLFSNGPKSVMLLSTY